MKRKKYSKKSGFRRFFWCHHEWDIINSDLDDQTKVKRIKEFNPGRSTTGIISAIKSAQAGHKPRLISNAEAIKRYNLKPFIPARQVIVESAIWTTILNEGPLGQITLKVKDLHIFHEIVKSFS